MVHSFAFSFFVVLMSFALQTPLAIAAPSLPPVEYCSGEDDDGDGETDEGYLCVQHSEGTCTTYCGSQGRRVCTAACVWGPCRVPEEVCNGQDDDCDGDSDEGFECIAERWGYCPLDGQGGRMGIGQCGPDCSWISCQEIPEERCNSLDDDGDGEVDEGNTCTLGMEPAPEVCNYRDDNGNGLIDEGIDYEVIWGPVEMEAEGPPGHPVGLSCEHERLAVLTDVDPWYNEGFALHIASLEGEWLAPSTSFCYIGFPGDARVEASSAGYVAACHGVERDQEDGILYWAMKLYTFDQVGNIVDGPVEVFDASHYQSEYQESQPYWDFAMSDDDGSILAVWVGSQVDALPTLHFRLFDEYLHPLGSSFDSGIGFFEGRVILKRDAGRWLLFAKSPCPSLPPDMYGLVSYEIDPEQQRVRLDSEFLGTMRTTLALVRASNGWAVVQGDGKYSVFNDDGSHQGVVSSPWGNGFGYALYNTKTSSIGEWNGQMMGCTEHGQFARGGLFGRKFNASEPWSEVDRSLGDGFSIYSINGCLLQDGEYVGLIGPYGGGLGRNQYRRILTRVGCPRDGQQN